MEQKILLEKIRSQLNRKSYRLRIHTVRHMVEEGFSEKDIVTAVKDGKILEYYPDDRRCLILGKFKFGDKAKLPLHVVCDFSNEKSVDIITAYIPQKPWWTTPTKRGGKR